MRVGWERCKLTIVLSRPSSRRSSESPPAVFSLMLSAPEGSPVGEQLFLKSCRKPWLVFAFADLRYHFLG